MAAGFGVRMLPITNYIPKPLISINGTKLIENTIFELRGIKYTYITYGYKSKLLVNELCDNVQGFINTTNKNNGWWLFNSFFKEIYEPIIVTTSDIIYEIDFNEVYEDYINQGKPACMIIPYETDKILDSDTIKVDNNIVTTINREKNSNLYASGIQILNPKMINHLINETDDFYKIWEELIKSKQLYCSNIKLSKWKSYDSIEDIINK